MDYKPPRKSVDFLSDDCVQKSKNNSVNMNGSSNGKAIDSPMNYFDIFDPSKNGDKILAQKRRQSNVDRRKSAATSEDPSNFENKRKFTIDPNNDKLGQSLKDVNLAGFSFLAQTRNYFMRIFWVCLISAAIIFLLYEIYKTINDYINSPVITTYTLQPKDKLDFPKVFICPAVFINASFYANHRQKSKDSLEILKCFDKIGSPKSNSMNSTFNERVFKRLDNTMNETSDGISSSSTLTNGNDAHDFLLNLGFDEEKIFQQCQFYGEEKQEKISCTEAVTPILDQRYGKCYQISVGDMPQTNDARGLSLMLDTNSKRYVKDKNLIQNYAGLFVSVDSAYQPTSYEKVLVQPGTYTKMSLSLEHFVMMNLESGALIQPCKENDVQNLTILNATYTQSSCQMECIYREVMDRCNCLPLINRDTILPEIRNKTDFCGKADIDGCIDANITNNDNAAKSIDECQNKCLPPCESWRYQIRSTGAPLNKLAFEGTDSLPGNASVDEIVLLDIAFTRLEYLELVQQPSMTFDTFVGNAGGQITLWIGGCMLTLLPLPLSLIAFCVMSCVARIHKRTEAK